MSNVQTRATLGDIGQDNLGPKFEKVFDQNLIKFEGKDIAKKIFDFPNAKFSTFRTTGLTGLKTLTRFGEGDPIPQSVNIKTFETNWDVQDYGDSVLVTDNLLEDRQKLGAKLDEMANLAKEVDITEAKGAFQILNGGFGTAAVVNGFSIDRYNDERLFLATHARADGGTAQSNVSATGITLTELNLETGRLALVKQLTDNGLPILNMGRITLTVPDDLQKDAVIFTQSNLRPSTANNDLNFYNGGTFDVVTSRWLNSNVGGSSTAWFLIASLPGMESILKVYRKGGPRMNDSGKIQGTWNRSFELKHRLAIGNSEFKGTWASPGV